MTPETRNEQTDDPLKDHNRLLIDLLFIGGILSANFDYVVESEAFPLQDLEPEDRMLIAAARDRLKYWRDMQSGAPNKGPDQ
mgnify:CR=1 FL=1